MTNKLTNLQALVKKTSTIKWQCCNIKVPSRTKVVGWAFRDASVEGGCALEEFLHGGVF